MDKKIESKPADTVPAEYKTLRVFEEGRNYKTTFTKKFEERKPWIPNNPEELKSFLPGTVEKLLVKSGDEVKLGDILMVFVAMKMHNLVRAPFNGKITAINVKIGDKVRKGVVMIVVSKAKEKVAKTREAKIKKTMKVAGKKR